MKLISIARLAAAGALLMTTHGAAMAGEKTLMHCFAWTPVKEATAADWQAFYKASDLLPQKIKGITKVWYGKLAAPLNIAGFAGQVEQPTFQKYQAGETVTAPVSKRTREYGMCMEMKDESVLKAYDADPYHKIWTDAYAKIRVEGTTTFNILGQ